MAEMTLADDPDVLSELLIAHLLDEDMRSLAASQEAESLQLSVTLSDSALAAGRQVPERSGSKSTKEPVPDGYVALSLFAQEARLSSDAAIAQSLQHLHDSNTVSGLQQAQRLAAAEKKLLLDAEFARRLQQEVDDEEDIDAENYQDAETLLGQDTIEQLLASDPNDKGKFRSKSFRTSAWEGDMNEDSEDDFSEPISHPTCGICMEPFQATYSPMVALASANSSVRLPFGLHLPCPLSHPYCHGCLSAYIRSKLNPDGDGAGISDAVVFPIRCPECPMMEWADGIPDGVAERVLSEKDLSLWHHQKLMDTLPRYYCPNPRCSVLVEVHDDPDEPQATCPSCSTLLCVPCRVVWHEDLTCEEYQALPLDERSPEDQQALQLMKAKHWRRCPNCAFIVELTVGCNHITCRCKTEFCFRCGSLWNTRTGSCTRRPPCNLWDEEMLLEERERERERRQVPAAVPPPPYAENDDRYMVARHAFDWMADPNILCSRHVFTKEMIQSLTCGYCNARLNSLADLQYHLRSVRRHSVFACCGRFFRCRDDLYRHSSAFPGRFGEHIHEWQSGE